MPVSKLVFIFVPVRELVWFPNSDWRVYLSFHSGSISAQTEILVWELGPSAQTGINESQFANWDPSSRTGTVRILGLTYIYVCRENIDNVTCASDIVAVVSDV